MNLISLRHPAHQDRRDRRQPVTIHGFRSSFQGLVCRENVGRDLAEAALAHAIKDKTEAAYNRTSMVERRREVMERWAAFAYATVNFAT